MAFNREPNKDFWGWADEDKKGENKSFGNVGAPLGANVQASNEQAPAPIVSQDPVDAQLKSMALGKGIEATATGIDAGIKAGVAQSAPLMMGVEGAATGAGSQAAMLAAQNAGLGAANAGAANALTNAALASAPSAVAGTGAVAGTAGTVGSAAAGGALAGGQAALAAMGPVGWTVGGLLLAKKFGLF